MFTSFLKDSFVLLVLRVSLRCLIYKVQAAHSRRSFSIAHSLSSVKHFFVSFETFCAVIQQLATASLSILAHSQAFVNTFFQLFSVPTVSVVQALPSRKALD